MNITLKQNSVESPATINDKYELGPAEIVAVYNIDQ